MKLLSIMFLAPFLVSITWAQEPDSLISQSMNNNVYKPAKVKATEERIAQLSLPVGFKISKFAEDLGKPRIMIAGPGGNVYLTKRSGDILMLKDSNGDGRANEQKTIGNKEGAHGMAIHQDQFYLITVNDVFRANINDDSTIGELVQIIDDLPDGGQHPNRTIAFGPDDMLYISIGSTCNACGETREESATMVISSPNGTGERTIMARGLRNTIGFDWHPVTKQLFGMDHGIDWLGDEEQKEELNRLKNSANYGWPHVYADSKFNLAREPEDMSWKEYAEKSTEPVMLFTAHSAPMNFKFYRGDMFPPEFKNSALVTFRGSWNRKPPSGYKVMKVNFDEGGNPVDSEDFITGFLSQDGTTQFARLVGLIEMEDGSVLISDDANGVIYRVSYERD